MFKINEKINQIFWYWIAERQRIFYARIQGAEFPWTTDKILQENKFCNAYRASDRFTQFLIKEVIYSSKYSQEPNELIFRILIARLFNKEETFSYLAERFSMKVEEFEPEKFISALGELKEKQALYSPAFFINPTKAFGHKEKYKNYVCLVENMLKTGLVEKIKNAVSLKEVYNSVIAYPLMGTFFSYQLAVDFNYSTVIDFDENSFVQPGPGALRGLNKIFLDFNGKNGRELINHLVENQEQFLIQYGFDPNSVWLWGRKLKAIDIQASLCEVDKYCRLAVPGEHAKDLKKIKVKFAPTPKTAINYFYPPKWHISEDNFSAIDNKPIVVHNKKVDYTLTQNPYAKANNEQD